MPYGSYGMASNQAGVAGGGGGGMGMGAMAGLSLIGTVASAYAQHQAGKANKRLMDYNAQIAEWQAQDAIDRGEVLASRRKQQTNEVIGSQRAHLAGQGVDINTGSAGEVQGNARYLGELDRLTIINNAKREAWGFKVQEKDATMRGGIMQQTADMQAASTLLTGSSNLLLASYGFGRGITSSNPLLVSR